MNEISGGKRRPEDIINDSKALTVSNEIDFGIPKIDAKEILKKAHTKRMEETLKIQTKEEETMDKKIKDKLKEKRKKQKIRIAKRWEWFTIISLLNRSFFLVLKV